MLVSFHGEEKEIWRNTWLSSPNEEQSRVTDLHWGVPYMNSISKNSAKNLESYLLVLLPELNEKVTLFLWTLIYFSKKHF